MDLEPQVAFAPVERKVRSASGVQNSICDELVGNERYGIDQAMQTQHA